MPNGGGALDRRRGREGELDRNGEPVFIPNLGASDLEGSPGHPLPETERPKAEKDVIHHLGPLGTDFATLGTAVRVKKAESIRAPSQ